MKPITQRSYNNAEVFKYENTRVQVISLETGGYAIEFRVLSDDLSQRALHSVHKGKIVNTGIKISPEAALSIIIGLSEQLKKDGLI